jgi:hypothetical protein
MGGTGAVTAPRPMMGTGAQSLTLVHTALEALQKSLVGLPMGSELHTAVLKAVTDISKRMNNESGDHSAQVQALAAMGRDAQTNPQAAAMQKMFPQPGAQPQPPAMPGPTG